MKFHPESHKYPWKNQKKITKFFTDLSRKKILNENNFKKSSHDGNS